MFEKFPAPAAALRTAPSKETMLQQVDQLRGLARQARKLAGNVASEDDQKKLAQYISELEESASKLEKAAAGARSG